KHTDKVCKRAKKCSKFLHTEYAKAKKAGFVVHDKKPEGDYRWFSSYSFTTGCTADFDYFGGQMVAFWMEGPLIDPLDYVDSMIRGYQDVLPKRASFLTRCKMPTLLDYQYFLLACIHDSQRRPAGQTPIFFDSSDSNDLGNRICQYVWATLTRYDIDVAALDTIHTTIQTALAGVKSDLTAKGLVYDWSRSKKRTHDRVCSHRSR
ncbi:MAG: hypothetical protein JSW59_03095, partial [Phycisphaerales bacterium]